MEEDVLMSEKETEEGEKLIVIEIGLKEIALFLLAIFVISLAALLVINYLKPRLNLEAKCFPNGTVVISGILMDGFNPVPGKYIAIQVTDENGATVWIDTVKTFNDGRFESIFVLKEGTRGRLDVYANSDIISEKTSFQVVG